MRKLSYLIFILSMLAVGKHVDGQTIPKEEFYLFGVIQGAKPGDNVYLKKRSDTLARGRVGEGGKYSLQGVIDGTADFYFLSFDSSLLKKPSDAIWMTADTIRVDAILEEWPKVSVKGAVVHNDYLATKKFVDSARLLPFTEGVSAIKAYMRYNVKSLSLPYFLIRLASLYRPTELDSLFTQLPTESKNSRYGLELGKAVEGKLKFSTTLNRVPNFAYSDTDGKIDSIWNAVSSSRYTLIDFWASWCAPCREHVPALKNSFSKFHDKGFNIISISIDKSAEDWKNAYKQLGTSWDHGLDNVSNANKTTLGLMAVPAYFLVDSTGKVIHASFFSSYAKISGKALDVQRDLNSILENLLK